MAIPPSAALHILETETTVCDGDGGRCSQPDHDAQDLTIEDYSTGDFVTIRHDMYCHNCDETWSDYIEYRA